MVTSQFLFTDISVLEQGDLDTADPFCLLLFVYSPDFLLFLPMLLCIFKTDWLWEPVIYEGMVGKK